MFVTKCTIFIIGTFHIVSHVNFQKMAQIFVCLPLFHFKMYQRIIWKAKSPNIKLHNRYCHTTTTYSGRVFFCKFLCLKTGYSASKQSQLHCSIWISMIRNSEKKCHGMLKIMCFELRYSLMFCPNFAKKQKNWFSSSSKFQQN